MSEPARTEVLARIRRALADRPGTAARPASAPIPREYVRAGADRPGSAAAIERFAERVAEYGAEVTRCAADDESIGTAVRAVLFAADVERVVTPAHLPDWVDHGGHVLDHEGLGAAELDQVDAVVSGCAVAIAQTGTFVLDGSVRCGRRAISLVPDLHICVVHTEQVVDSVPEALARLDPVAPLTFVSGPSATSDIELDRVEGVHGPRRLHVIIAGDPS